MNAIVELFNTIRQTPGPSKVQVLKAHHSEEVALILKDAMDPSIKYGVTSASLHVEDCGDHRAGDWYGAFHALLQRLASRELTGRAAEAALENELSLHDTETAALLEAVLDKDLKLGISWKTYQEEVLGVSDAFEVALAMHLEKAKGVDPVDGTWFASRKCDGLRLVAIASPNGIEFRSRQNKEFLTLENLKADVQRFCEGLQGTWVLDGELCKVDENGDEDFQSIVKEARRKDYQIEDCCYQLFDILPYDEFKAGKSVEGLSARLLQLEVLNDAYVKQPHGRCWVKPLKQERLHSQDDFDRWSKYVEEGNWEGFMLRKDVPYKNGRSKDLLKVKKFFDAEYVVEGVETGEMTTALPGEGLVKYQGVTNLWISHKGNRVGVGAGLTREQRIEWLEDPSKIVGKVVCVKYFEETENKEGSKSLRFPTLKFVYGDKRDV